MFEIALLVIVTLIATLIIMIKVAPLAFFYRQIISSFVGYDIGFDQHHCRIGIKHLVISYLKAVTLRDMRIAYGQLVEWAPELDGYHCVQLAAQKAHDDMFAEIDSNQREIDSLQVDIDSNQREIDSLKKEIDYLNTLDTIE